MHEELLREAGLSLNESKVYETLLGIGAANVEKISLKSKVHRRNTYDSLNKLVEKGLISEIFVHNQRNFKAISPTRLVDLIREKEDKISKILPELQLKFNSVSTSEEAYMYRGIEGFKNYLQDILDSGETVYFIGAKGFWLDPRLKHAINRFEKERKKKGIKFMHLFDYEVKEQKLEILQFIGKPYKFLPKEYSSLTAVDIFGDYVVTFVGAKPGELDQEPVQFVMKSRKLADGYRKFFQFMWDNCKKQ